MNITDELDIRTAEEQDTEAIEAIAEPDLPEAETTEPQEEEAIATTKRKGPFIQVPVIISLIIVLLTVIGYFTYTFFFLREPEGVLWSADYDGATYYYEFNADKTFKSYVGSVEISSTYDKLKSDDKNQIVVNTQAGDFYTGMAAEYEITGSRILGNQEFNLNYGEDYQFTLKQTAEREDPLELPENFTPDEALTGTWKFDYYGYTIYEVTFREDGSMQLNFVQDGICYNGTYTIEDGVINFTYYVGESIVSQLEYKVNNDTLEFLGMTFTRVSDKATPDEV